MSLIVERRLPKKKRQRRGFQFEEQPNQRIVVAKEAYDRDFEDDSDNDNGDGDDFTSRFIYIKTSLDLDVYVDDKGGTKCDKVSICEKYLHKSEFRGSLVFELYRVKLSFNINKERPLSGKLYGVIDVIRSNENPDPIYYYRVTKENVVPITRPNNNTINLTLFEFGCLDEDVDAELFDDGHGIHTAKYAFITYSPCTMEPGREFCSIQRELLWYSNSDAIKVALQILCSCAALQFEEFGPHPYRQIHQKCGSRYTAMQRWVLAI
ncbi:hypothetical protein DITRI_Ditri13aG0001100 [Diplodiscus trichospermus]